MGLPPSDSNRLILLIERLMDAELLLDEDGDTLLDYVRSIRLPSHEVDIEAGIISGHRFLEILENFLHPLSFDAWAKREALDKARQILYLPTE